MLKNFVIGGWTAFTILLLVIVFVGPIFADDSKLTPYSEGASDCCWQTDASSIVSGCCQTTAPAERDVPSCCR